MEEFLNAVKNNPDHAYDYIAQHYYEMSKFDLRTILLEYIFGLSKNWSEAEVIESLVEDNL